MVISAHLLLFANFTENYGHNPKTGGIASIKLDFGDNYIIILYGTIGYIYLDDKFGDNDREIIVSCEAKTQLEGRQNTYNKFGLSRQISA